MIVADRREGGILAEADTRSAYAPVWRSLDRNLPLGPKLIVPVILVTLLGALPFGFLVAQQSRIATEASYEASARIVADTAAADFYAETANREAVDYDLLTIAAVHPELNAIYIVQLNGGGNPVVASSSPSDLGKIDIIDQAEAAAARQGVASQDRHVYGNPVLQTIVPVHGNAYAVVVRTSLDAENAAIASALLWVGVAALLVCVFEVGAMATILEFGVLRRIRRIRRAVDAFGRSARHARLSEGFEPEGRDALFNLARKMDQKLSELSERERAGSVVSELGLLALQGALPSDLTLKALEITRQAGDLERCFLVDTSGAVTIVGTAADSEGATTEAKLPVWLGALVRSATQARRPILADGLGQDCRYWEAGSANASASAAFVPLAGTPNPIGVMVGVARTGGQISPVTVSMMEAVATALGESLQRSEAEKARHDSEAKSKALSTVSHEMRNPLNAMLGFSNLLLTGAAGPLNEKQQTYVHRVDDASHHLLRLVNDYLDLSRVMNGSLPVQPEAVVVALEVQSILDLLGPTAAAKNVSLHSEVPPDATARADRLRLRQVLMNLVSNAIKFTPARGHVRVEVAGGSNGVRISVIDTGVGIPADRQHLVFTEFAQLRASGRGEGSGLGLALTKRFVEAMGGFIRFTSSEGAGTIFDVWLPGEQSPRHAAEPVNPVERSAGAA